MAQFFLAVYAVLIVAGVFGLCLCAGRALASRVRSYQGEYRKRAEASLDALYLDIPSEDLLIASLAVFVVLGASVFFATGNLPLSLVVGASALLLPRVALVWLRKRREKKFTQEIPAFLTALRSGLRGGLSLVQSVENGLSQTEGPMRQEMNILLQQSRLGMPVQNGFREIYSRMPVEDMRLVVTAVDVVERVGGNLAILFENIERTIRNRDRITQQVRTITAGTQLQALLMGGLPFFILAGMSLLDPGLMRVFFQSMVGWSLVALMVVLNTIGFLFMRKMLDVEI